MSDPRNVTQAQLVALIDSLDLHIEAELAVGDEIVATNLVAIRQASRRAVDRLRKLAAAEVEAEVAELHDALEGGAA